VSLQGDLVEVSRTGLSERVHTIDLELAANSAVVVHLADGSVHRLLELLHCEPQKSISAHQLHLFLSLSDLLLAHVSLPLRDTDKHVFLGIQIGEDDSSLRACLDDTDKGVRHRSIKAEGATKDMLRVKSRQQSEMAADSHTCDEEFVSPATHSGDLALTNLLHVGVALGLKEILSVGVPATPLAFFCVLEDHRGLDHDDIDQLIEAKYFIGRLAEESVNVGLRVLPMVVQKDTGCRPGVHQAAVRGRHGLEDDIVADIVFEEPVLSNGFFRFFASHI